MRFLPVLLLVVNTVLAAPPPGELELTDSRASVLLLIDLSRGFATAAANADGNLDAAKALLARDEELLVMYRRLYERRAVSLEEYEAVRRRHAVSKARVAQATKAVEQATAERDAVRTQIDAKLGTEMTVRDLFGSYRKAWTAGCDRIDREKDEAAANVDYTRFRYDMARRLYSKQAESYENVLLRQGEFLEAFATLQAKSGRGKTCRTEYFPTYEEFVRLIGP